jgi:hypothetical protein
MFMLPVPYGDITAARKCQIIPGCIATVATFQNCPPKKCSLPLRKDIEPSSIYTMVEVIDKYFT